MTAAIAKEIEPILAFRGRLAERLPAISKEMDRRVATGKRKVQVERVADRLDEEGNWRRERIVSEEELVGLDMWTRPPHRDLMEQGARLRRETDRGLAKSPDPDHEDARRLARRIEKLDETLRRASDWVSRVRPFFHDTNLALVAYAAGQPHRDRGAGVRVLRQGEEAPVRARAQGPLLAVRLSLSKGKRSAAGCLGDGT